jgi:DNA polymerase III epsilon subunit family exonuclease
MSNYAVIDFETANSDMTSICQIGVVLIEDGVITKEWATLVKPSGEFNSFNVKLHGITEEHVKEAPDFLAIYDELIALIKNKIVVSHGAFDKSVLAKAQELHGLNPEASITWLDATRIIRNVLPQFTNNGYGLQNIAVHFSLTTNPHNALDDAKTCAVIVNKLLDQSNTSINDWIELSKKTIRFDINLAVSNIKRQCLELDWPYEEIKAIRQGSRKWSDGKNLIGVTPEDIVVSYLRQTNPIVNWCEGTSVILFLKACVLDFFTDNHWLGDFSSRDDALRDALHLQLNQLKERIDDVAEEAVLVTDSQLTKNIEEICADEVIQHMHPNLSKKLMFALIGAMPKVQRATLLKTLSTDVELTSGWPDITIINDDNKLSFVEVKTTDNFRDSQIKFAKQVAHSNNLKCSVIRVRSEVEVLKALTVGDKDRVSSQRPPFNAGWKLFKGLGSKKRK